MVFYILWKTSYNYFPLPSHFTPMASTILPTSSNHDQLCHFFGWQSTNASTSRHMKFSSDKALCIDSGASCCISNNKDDFISFSTTQSSVVHGISSCLTIAGTATCRSSIPRWSRRPPIGQMRWEQGVSRKMTYERQFNLQFGEH